MTENEIGKEVVDAALKVHRELGPGLLEMVYRTEAGLCADLWSQSDERGYRAGRPWPFRAGSWRLGVRLSRISNQTANAAPPHR